MGRLEDELHALQERSSDSVSSVNRANRSEAPTIVSTPPVSPLVVSAKRAEVTGVPVAPWPSSETVAKEVRSDHRPTLLKESVEAVPAFSWKPLLSKIGLLPPDAGEVSLTSWWTTRIGLALAVITAVFLGIYVNQDTNPLLRLCQLIGAGGLVLVAGLYLEKKLRSFGQALGYGGLSLLYVAGYACYGLPAMKVTDSPWIGFWAQVLAFLAIAGFSLWRAQPRGFTLALVLGYITSYFSLREGIAPMPYFSLVSLAGVGIMVYVMRRWLAAYLVSLVGTGGGLPLYCWLSSPAIFTPTSLSDTPSALPMLLTGVILCALYLATLCWRYRRTPLQASLKERHYLPSITFGVWLFVGVSAFLSLGLKAEWAYASFTLVALITALSWRLFLKDQRQFISFTLKASALGAICIISWLDGSTRAFTLLGQACMLLVFAHREKSKVIEGGAMVVWMIGFFLMTQTFPANVKAAYGATPEWIRTAFLIGSLGLVLLHQWLYNVQKKERRAILQGLLLGGVGIALSYSCGSSLSGDWAWGIPLGVVTVYYILESRLVLIPRLVLPLVVLGYMFIELINTQAEWESSVLWIVTAWLFIYGEMCRQSKVQNAMERKPHLILHHVLILLSMVVYFRLGDLILPHEWVPVWLLSLAVVWKALGRFIPYLSITSFCPAIIGVLSIMGGLSTTDTLPKSGVLFLSFLYFLIGWKGVRVVHQRYSPSLASAAEWFRMIILFLPYIIFLQSEFSDWSREGRCVSFILLGMGGAWCGREIRERALSIGAVVFFLCALLLATNFTSWFGFSISCVLLMALIFTGLQLGRDSDVSEPLYHPRTTAAVYGTLSFITIFIGWSQNGVSASVLTALWSLGSVVLVLSGFLGKLRTYRVLGLVGLALSLGKLFIYDMDDTFWRIIGFGVTSLLFIGLGFLYNKFHQRLATGDHDWGKIPSTAEEEAGNRA